MLNKFRKIEYIKEQPDRGMLSKTPLKKCRITNQKTPFLKYAI